MTSLASSQAALPRFDPLAPRPQERAFRRVLIVSLVLHLILLAVFWDQVFGVILEKDETVTVRMVEDEPPPPRRKVIAQSRIDTQVQKFREFEQIEIQEIRPEVLDQTQTVDLARLESIQAPRTVERTDIQVQRQSVFAEKPVAVPTVQVNRASPRVVASPAPRAARPSSGPRRVEAASPRANPKAISAQPAQVREGVVSSRSVAGAKSGDIAALEGGAGDAFLIGSGEKGELGGSDIDCMKDPKCLAYLKLIRDRVYARWTIPPDIEPGRVVLAFRVDRGGAAHNIQVRHSDDEMLGSTCRGAFRHASPFPPPPREIQYIVNKAIRATFHYGR
jgi:TonB family protein